MKLLIYPDKRLLAPCKTKVTEFNEDLHKTLDDMARLMRASHGIGLAANQVGLDQRMFIAMDYRREIWDFINPRIIELDERKANIEEGCLSAPVHSLAGISGSDLVVPSRSLNVLIEAQDRNREHIKVAAYGVEAVCIQHEYDHLNGEFFFNKLLSRPIKRKVEKAWKKAQKKLNRK